jgi:hypothetical protein
MANFFGNRFKFGNLKGPSRVGKMSRFWDSKEVASALLGLQETCLDFEWK